LLFVANDLASRVSLVGTTVRALDVVLVIVLEHVSIVMDRWSSTTNGIDVMAHQVGLDEPPFVVGEVLDE
ncbi:hypothetical protein CLOP_g7852, partial [Closterium sp. NIES-67]